MEFGNRGRSLRNPNSINTSYEAYEWFKQLLKWETSTCCFWQSPFAWIFLAESLQASNHGFFYRQRWFWKRYMQYIARWHSIAGISAIRRFNWVESHIWHRVCCVTHNWSKALWDGQNGVFLCNLLPRELQDEPFRDEGENKHNRQRTTWIAIEVNRYLHSHVALSKLTNKGQTCRFASPLTDREIVSKLYPCLMLWLKFANFKFVILHKMC